MFPRGLSNTPKRESESERGGRGGGEESYKGDGDGPYLWCGRLEQWLDPTPSHLRQYLGFRVSGLGLGVGFTV
jgi:hypothetical protein